jgi:hypothetical protein
MTLFLNNRLVHLGSQKLIKVQADRNGIVIDSEQGAGRNFSFIT